MMEYFGEGNETLEQLEMLIGKENAVKVFEFFEGSNIYFPKRIGLDERKEQIYADLQSGLSYGDTARKYGYSKSYIRKIEHKVNEKRREIIRQTGKLPEMLPVNDTKSAAKPKKVTVLTTPKDIETSSPFQQGDLFYEE